MRVGAFQGVPYIREVSCSGATLDSDANVFSMALYEKGRQLAQVNVMTNECTTSGRFSSCDINTRDSRRSVLKTLLIDLSEEETKEFVCELNSLKTGGRPTLTVWNLEVDGWSEFDL